MDKNPCCSLLSCRRPSLIVSSARPSPFGSFKSTVPGSRSSDPFSVDVHLSIALRIPAPPATATVIANANPSGRNSHRSKRKSAVNEALFFRFAAGDSSAVTKGIKAGPSERERESAYVRRATWTGCVGSAGRLGPRRGIELAAADPFNARANPALRRWCHASALFKSSAMTWTLW